MVQEILTYIILGAAIAFAFSAIFRPFVKNSQKKGIIQESSAEKCVSCPAECMLREANYQKITKNEDCETIRKESE